MTRHTAGAACKYCGKPLKLRIVRTDDVAIYAGREPCSCAMAMRAAEELDVAEDEGDLHRMLIRHERSLRGARIPKHYRHAKLAEEDYTFLEAVLAGKSVMFYGDIGVGKTHRACAIANSLVDEMQVMFATSKSINDAEFNDKDVLQRFEHCDLLVLDDAGKMRAESRWYATQLFDIVNTRYEADRPVIVTSNYSPSGLIKVLAKAADIETATATVSRLREMCGPDPVRMTGVDLRVQPNR